MRALLLTVLVASSLAGCIGVPEGSADHGDTVTVDWTAYDLETGAQLLSRTGQTFQLGSGQSGLGFDFERNLIALPVNETTTFTSHEDPSRPYPLRFTVERFYDQNAVADAPRSAFAQQIGEPSVGMTFEFGLYGGVVEAVTDQTVTYRIVTDGTLVEPLPSLGAVLHARVEGDTLVQELRADVGAELTVQQPSAFNPNPPLPGMSPGSYQALGHNATHLEYAYSPLMDVSGLDAPLRFEVTIRDVQAFTAEPGDGLGSRSSPQLLARPGDVHPTPGTSDASHDDHGHTH